MLPTHILQEFKQGRTSLKAVRYHEQMTCLYADISGFTAYSKAHGAESVVKLVTKLFSTIDDLSRKVGIYKVCTIGDCYVATLNCLWLLDYLLSSILMITRCYSLLFYCKQRIY